MERGKFTVSAFIQVVQIMRMIRPDIVQTWMYHADFVGGLAARYVGIRSIFWNVRNSNLKINSTSYKTVILVKFLAFLSHVIPLRVIVCSKVAEQIHISHGFKKEKFFYIPNGCDLGIFRNCLSSTLLSEKAKKINHIVNLGMIARWHPQKNHEGLFQALSLVNERGYRFHCILAGPGISADNRTLINLVKKMNLGKLITMLGQRKDVPNILKMLDFHILSSSYGEASPNAVIEAMACGIPCIATNVGDTQHIIGNTGWIVSPGDVLGLVDAIEDAIKSFTMPEFMIRSHAAIERIEQNFSLDKMVNAYEKVWSESMKD